MSCEQTDAEIIASLPDGLPFGLWVARAPGGEFVYANPRFQEIMGIAGRDDVAVGEYAEPYGIYGLDGELYPEEQMPFVRALQAGHTVVVDDIVIHRHDGGRVNIRAWAEPVYHHDEVSHVVIAFADITREIQAEQARREADARMRQSQRMEAIGNLASGIAHDFNNLLGAIRIIASSLAATETDPERLKSLQTIDGSTASARELTRSLLGFAGKVQEESWSPLHLDDLVHGVADLFGRALGARYALELELGSTRSVRADRPRLEQVLMNLLINARDAMPEGGTIRIRTEDRGEDAILHVVDQGPGVPEAIRERIFEPYFTTNGDRKNRGVGLGLATAYGIVLAHGGTLGLLDTEVGAHFEVCLPAADAQTDTEAASPAPTTPDTRALQVLVVDDEDLVRDAAVLALQTLGHEPTPARSGPEALEAITSGGQSFDAVVLDLAMPGMDGRQTLAALRALAPDLSVILASGYAVDDSSLKAEGVQAVLQKPYGLQELAAALERALR